MACNSRHLIGAIALLRLVNNIECLRHLRDRHRVTLIEVGQKYDGVEIVQFPLPLKVCLLRIELGNSGSQERYPYPVGIALNGVRLLFWIFLNNLLTVTGVIFVAKELPLDDTLDVCSVRWRLRTLEKTWKDIFETVSLTDARGSSRYGFRTYSQKKRRWLLQRSSLEDPTAQTQ